jgi:hypothetical protein
VGFFFPGLALFFDVGIGSSLVLSEPPDPRPLRPLPAIQEGGMGRRRG